MSFTSYDRKSYRESKRRRRQAMRQNETGIIKPFRRRNKPLFIGVAAAVLLCAVAALVFFHPFAPAQKEAQRRAEWEQMDIAGHVDYYEQQGMDRKAAMKQAALDRGISRRDVYRALLD